MNIPPNFLRCLHRPPVHKPYGHQPPPQVPLPEPEQPAPALARQGSGEAPRPGCPIVSITHCRVRLLDTDAKWAAVKDVLDGLQYAGLIHSDKEGEIDLQVTQAKVQRFQDEETLISIYYPEKAKLAASEV